MIRFVLAAARKDLAIRMRDPFALLLWIGIPLLLGGLMSMVAGGASGPTPRGTVYIADEDGSIVSGFITRALAQGQLGEMLQVVDSDFESGKVRLDAGEGSALIRIPAGFGRAVLRDEATKLTLLQNPSQTILPKIVEEALELLSDAVFYMHRVLGDELHAIVDSMEEQERTNQRASLDDFLLTSRLIGTAMHKIDTYAFPPVLRVEIVNPAPKAEAAPKTPMSLLFLPGILIMAIFFMAQGLSDDTWREREAGTLQRAATTPQTLTAFFLGKTLASGTLMAGVSAFGLAVGMGYHGIDFMLFPIALVWAVLGGLVLFLVMVWFQTLASTARGGSVFTSILLFPLLMIGGSFFPFAAMPSWMVTIGSRTPNGWCVLQLDKILRGVPDYSALAFGSLGMLGLGSLFLFLILSRVRRRWMAA